MKRLLGCILALSCTLAAAQPCPKPAEVKVEHLIGIWQAQVQGMVEGASLELARHPRYVDSVAGDIVRNGVRALVSGEIEGAEFSMEESADGTHISATWVGEFVDGTCGREIRGTWQRDGVEQAYPFVMKKQ